MKPKSILSMSLFAALAALSIGAQAAPETDKAAEAKAPAVGMQADKPAPKKMKPHSHVEEKTGMPQKAPEATADKPSPEKDTSKHLHPRDAK